MLSVQFLLKKIFQIQEAPFFPFSLCSLFFMVWAFSTANSTIGLLSFPASAVCVSNEELTTHSAL